MNKNESKYFNTASLFDKTLINLLENKDLEYITIKEICSKAGVNRSTFYLHYENINDVVEETMNYINTEFIRCFNEDSKEFINKIQNSKLDELILIEKRYLTPYLNFIKENKKVFKASFNNPIGMHATKKYDHLKYYILNPILDRFSIDEKDKKYLLAFYINGIMAIIKEWLDTNCQDSIDDIQNIIIKCVKENPKKD